MDEQTQKLIQQLADKLGTTAEHLWAVLVKQAPIFAVTELVSDIAICGALIWLTRFMYGKYKKVKEFDEDLSHIWFASTVVCLISAIVCVVWSCTSLDMVSAGLFNPEYYALKQIIK